MISRRGMLMAFAAIATPLTVTASVPDPKPAGFRIRGVMGATDEEAAQGFGAIGNDFALYVNPESAAYPHLLDLLSREVSVTVEPT